MHALLFIVGMQVRCDPSCISVQHARKRAMFQNSLYSDINSFHGPVVKTGRNYHPADCRDLVGFHHEWRAYRIVPQGLFKVPFRR